MSEQNKPDDKSSQAVPAIAVAALVVSLFAAQEIILKPTRPAMINAESASTEDVRARLWQDPFQAVETYREQFYSQIRSAQQQTITLKYPDSEETLQIESTKKNQSVAFKGETGIAFHIENKFKRLVCSSEKHPETTAHSIEELRCQIYEKIKKKEKEEGKSVHVLAVMMPGGPYAENHEWRLRSRHALIYGLRAAGYSPVEPTHIGFVDFEHACLNATKKQGEQRKQEISYCGFPDFMPYEWFELNERLKPIDIETLSGKNGFKLSSNDKKERVLIVWLNNDTFNHRWINSIDTLDRLKKEILPTSEIEQIDESKISFNIIGPNSSGTLKKMYADIQKINSSENSLEHNYFFVNAVTADQRRLVGGTKKNPSEKLLDDDQVKRLNDKVIRTISTQEELVHTLLCELALRGVTPSRPDPNEPIAEKCPDVKEALPSRQSDQPHHMVLIGELDSFYSQALTETILDKITEFGDVNRRNLGHIHTFNYLRGLDGITSEQAATSQGSKNKESQANKLSDKELKEQQERPTETSQLDYLLRLAERIDQLDKEKSSVGGIQAIGITGGDTYDKLLILQALRPKFPKTLFFTTDLDARLFHSSEIESTRNLIVASPFGLQFNDEWQKDAPPFRDNYQTALYLTTLIALHFPQPETEAKTKEQDSVSALKEFLENLRKKPRLFEIGNDGAVDLSHTAGNGIHPEPEFTSVSKATDWEYILIISGPLLIATILAFFLTSLAPVSFRPNIVRVFNCLIFLILVIICFQIPVIVAIILLAFLLQFLVPTGAKPIIIGVFISIVLLLISYHIFPLSDGYGSEPLASGTSIWPANAIKFVAIILAGCFLIIIYQELKKDKEEIEIKYISKDGKKKNEKNCPSPASSGENAIVLEPIIHDNKHPFIYEWASLKNIFRNKQLRTQINETTKNFWTRLNIDRWEIDSGEEPPSFKDLWSDYLGLRTIFWSLVITIIMFLLFCGFVGWLFMMDFLHIPEIPFRGNVSLRIHYITLILAALFYLILIFLIVDITHLCSHFINLLSGQDVRWPDDLVRINKSKYSLPREAVEHKILFDFIHQHTRIINKFIYYPFFILFLILLSRSNYFDNWQITSFLLFFFGFTALIALSSVINLRIAAQDARERILEKLDNYSLQLMENKARHKHDDNAAKLKLLTQEIKDFEEGVFQPLSHHPIVLSVLLPLSSIAGVYLFDYLSLAF